MNIQMIADECPGCGMMSRYVGEGIRVEVTRVGFDDWADDDVEHECNERA